VEAAPVDTAFGQTGLVLRDVSFGYDEVPIIRRQSLHIPRGETLLVSGANGVGKSTLLYVCAGLLEATEGEVVLDGHPADAEHPSVLVRQGIVRGFVFQHGGLVANRSALGNVALGLRYHADVLGLNEQTIDERARRCLARLGVHDREVDAMPGTLSYGIRRRVALARVMALEPNFAFFDDPDAGLDRRNAEAVYDLLEQYRDAPDVTTMIASNHALLIDRLGVPANVLENGRLVELDESDARLRLSYV
jgi:phospholipid/cholesterol/gamma-HCH transport system ATP-binding protein